MPAIDAALFAERTRQALDRKRHPDGKRWTQKDLAEAIGAMPNTVNGWLNRGVLPPGPTRKLVAQVLDVSVEFLEGASDEYAVSYAIPVVPGLTFPVREAFTPNPSFRRRLPPRAYELAYGYLHQLEEIGLAPQEIAEAERFLMDAAYNKLNSRDRKERTEDDMLKDLRAAWVFVKEVLGDRGAAL